MFATVLLGVSLPMLFINPLAGIACFVVGGVIATFESKEAAKDTRKRKKLEDADREYNRLKATQPTAPATFKVFEDSRDAWRQGTRLEHNEYLLRKLENFERKFHENGFTIAYSYDGGVVKLSENSDYEIEKLFANPDEYVKICKHLYRAPLDELVKEWKAENSRLRARKERVQKEKMEIAEISPIIVSIVRQNISELVSSGRSYRSILETIKSRFNNLHKYNFSVKCENEEWSISILDYIEKFQVRPNAPVYKGALLSRDSDGRTGLYYCSTKSEVRALVACGLDVNEKDRLGNSPIHINEIPQATEALLDFGADIDALNNIGSTALDRAVLFKNIEKSALLVSRGARRKHER